MTSMRLSLFTLIVLAGCAGDGTPPPPGDLEVATDIPVLEDDRSPLEIAGDATTEAFGLEAGSLDCPDMTDGALEAVSCTAVLEGEAVPLLVQPDSTAPDGMAWMLDGVLLREHTERNMEEQLSTLDGPDLEVDCDGPAVRPAVADEVLSCRATDAATGEVTVLEATVLEAYTPRMAGAVSWSFDGTLYAATPERSGSR